MTSRLLLFLQPYTLKTYHSRDATWLGRPYLSPSKNRGSGNVLPQEDNVIASDDGSKYIDESDDDDYIPAITGIVEADSESEDSESEEEKVTTRSGKNIIPPD